MSDPLSKLKAFFTGKQTADLVPAAARQRAIDAAIDLAVGDINDPEAFRRLVDAVAVYLGATSPTPPGKPRARAAPVVPFGPKKGRPLSALTPPELERLERWLTGAIHNQQREEYREANLSLRAAVRSELQARTLVTP